MMVQASLPLPLTKPIFSKKVIESDLRSMSAWVSFLLQISVRASHENPTTFLGVRSLFVQHVTNPAKKTSN
jgi:hypothetical protein